MLGVGNGNPAYFGLSKIFNALESEGTVTAFPKRDASASINGLGVGKDKFLLFQLVNEGDIRGSKKVNRSTLFDLLGQLSRGAKVKSYLDARLLLEHIAKLFKGRSQDRGC